MTDPLFSHFPSPFIPMPEEERRKHLADLEPFAAFALGLAVGVAVISSLTL